MAKKTKAHVRAASSVRARFAARLRANGLPVAICALALVVYSRSLFCGFVRDDHAQIVHNPQIQSWSYLPVLLASHLWSHEGTVGPQQLFYRPLFSLWMLLVHTAGGLEPWFWHLSSLVLHVAATWLVFRLCLRLTASQPAAAIAAALFAVHPVHVDAVTWVSASNEVLSTLFVLGAVLLLLRDRPTSRLSLWSSAALFCAAMFSKETGAAMLPVLLAVAWARLRNSGPEQPWQRLWKASLPYLAATSIFAAARALAVGRLPAQPAEHTWAEIVFTSPSLILFYLRKLVLPLGLSPSYINPVTATPAAGFWLELFGILLALSVIAWVAIKRRPLAALAAAWILLPLLPALVVLRLYPEGDMTHDRYLYAPSVGLCILAAMLAQYFWSQGKRARQMTVAAAIALVSVLAALTFAQQSYYQDDASFYQRAIQVNPDNAPAYSALGDLDLDQGLLGPALENHRKAHALAPANAQITLLLARALFVEKQYAEAEALLSGLLSDPALGAAHRLPARLSLANVQIELKNFTAAQTLLDQVERDAPDTPELHWAKAILFQRQGLFPQAQTEYQREYQITGDPAAKRQAMILSRQIPASTHGN